MGGEAAFLGLRILRGGEKGERSEDIIRRREEERRRREVKRRGESEIEREKERERRPLFIQKRVGKCEKCRLFLTGFEGLIHVESVCERPQDIKFNINKVTQLGK